MKIVSERVNEYANERENHDVVEHTVNSEQHNGCPNSTLRKLRERPDLVLSIDKTCGVNETAQVGCKVTVKINTKSYQGNAQKQEEYTSNIRSLFQRDDHQRHNASPCKIGADENKSHEFNGNSVQHNQTTVGLWCWC